MSALEVLRSFLAAAGLGDIQHVVKRRSAKHLREDALQVALLGVVEAMRRYTPDDPIGYAIETARNTLIHWSAKERRNGRVGVPKEAWGSPNEPLPERRLDDGSAPEPIPTSKKPDTWRLANETEDAAIDAIDSGRRPRDIAIDLRELQVKIAFRASPVFNARPTWLASELPPTRAWCRSPTDKDRQWRAPITPLRDEQRALWARAGEWSRPEEKRHDRTISDSEMPVRGLLIGRGVRRAAAPLIFPPHSRESLTGADPWVTTTS